MGGGEGGKRNAKVDKSREINGGGGGCFLPAGEGKEKMKYSNASAVEKIFFFLSPRLVE